MRGGILTKNAASLFRLRHHPGKDPRQNLRKSSRTPSRPSPQRPQLQSRTSESQPKEDAPHCSPQHGNPAARRRRQSAGKRAGQPGGSARPLRHAIHTVRPVLTAAACPSNPAGPPLRPEHPYGNRLGCNRRPQRTTRKIRTNRQPAEESELRREAARNTRWIRLATESG